MHSYIGETMDDTRLGRKRSFSIFTFLDFMSKVNFLNLKLQMKSISTGITISHVYIFRAHENQKKKKKRRKKKTEIKVCGFSNFAFQESQSEWISLTLRLLYLMYTHFTSNKIKRKRVNSVAFETIFHSVDFVMILS